MLQLLQWILLGVAFALAWWAQTPATALAGLILIAAGTAVQGFFTRISRGLALLGSVAVWATMFRESVSWNLYFVAPALLVALVSCVSYLREESPGPSNHWKKLTMMWVFASAGMWLGGGYMQDQPIPFYSGLLAMSLVLLMARIMFRWGTVGGQALVTSVLVLFLLPIVDKIARPLGHASVTAANCHQYYSFDASKGDPSAFGKWSEYYTSQFDKLGTDLFVSARGEPLPFRLKPGGRATFVNCPISINHLGFRGEELTPHKDEYRIVALGESTTFGMTIEPDDKPWPEVLEQLIREKLKPKRPVRVINAGAPAYSLLNNLYRLQREIASLHPDLIISYHGANGFNLLNSSVLPPLGPAPPVYRERPLNLLAEAEHRLRMMWWIHNTVGSAKRDSKKTSDPMQTIYAAAYRQLIGWAHTNSVRLALANYSMAVNPKSDSRVIDFYRGGGNRAAYGFMQANAVHTRILDELAKENPDLCVVDTHPHLDGEHEKFIDLIHFTAEGDRQLAENIFAGISNVLAREIAPAP